MDKIYNGAGTAISEKIKEFTECIEDYLNEKDIKWRTLYWERIKKMLSRESSFAGFKRSIVRESKELMQCFGELLV